MSRPYVTVPAGTPASRCPACGRPVYLVGPRREAALPRRYVTRVDCQHDARCLAPTRWAAGSGVEHAEVCVVALLYRPLDALPSPARLPGDATGGM